MIDVKQQLWWAERHPAFDNVGGWVVVWSRAFLLDQFYQRVEIPLNTLIGNEVQDHIMLQVEDDIK